MMRVNGINVHYQVHGQGEWLVLIAGLGTDLSIFKPYVDVLSKDFRVLVFDNRGAGQSDKPDVPYSVQMMAQDTVSLMDALDIEHAHILGVSLGGRIAMQLALDHQQRVKKLILVSTSPSLQARLSVVMKAMKRIRSLSRSQQPYYAFKRQLAASSGYDCTDRLHQITAPTLVIYGKNDRLANQTQAEEMKKRIASCGLVGFDGGHWFFMLHANQVIDEVRKFLA